MISVPDGVEVVLTERDAARVGRPPLLIVEPVARFVRACALGDGVYGWQRIGDGQSNVTYLLDLGARRVVLRRGPRPPLPPSAHDMVREARVQRLLADAGVPVPEILAVCDDDAILGVPFYLMAHIDGHVVTHALPAAFADARWHAPLVMAAVDALADLRAVDVASGPLAEIGRPDGYLERQVRRFAGLWQTNSRRDLPLVDELAERLRRRMPATQRHAVVHGDYRIGNLMYARDAPPRIAAILDWEMATLGDPLADLGYLTATYARPGSTPTPLELTSVTRGETFPDTAALVRRYAERHPIDLAPLPWYEALALWKAAVFCEAMYTRWLAGERPGDTFGPMLAEGVPQLLAAAAERLR